MDLLKFLAPVLVRITKRLELFLPVHTCTHTCEKAETNAQLMLNDKKSNFFLSINFQSKKIKPTGSKNEKLCLKVVIFTPVK